jgi:hypothetical protein
MFYEYYFIFSQVFIHLLKILILIINRKKRQLYLLFCKKRLFIASLILLVLFLGLRSFR